MMYNRLKIRIKTYGLNSQKHFFDFHYPMYSLIMNRLFYYDKALFNKIHGNNIKRPFLYSNLFLNGSYGHFYITSAYSEVFKALSVVFSDSFSNKNISSFDDKIFVLKSSDQELNFFINSVELETLEVNSSNFALLSPFVLRHKDGTYIQNKDLVLDYLYNNINRVSKKIFGKSFDFDISLNGKLKKKVFFVNKSRKIPIYAWSFTKKDDFISINSNDDLFIHSLLYFGIGDKTSFGFGMLAPKW